MSDAMFVCLFVCLFVHGTGPRHRNHLVAQAASLWPLPALSSDLLECLRSLCGIDLCYRIHIWHGSPVCDTTSHITRV